MVILGPGEGRLANRLLISAHALAYCIRNKETFIDLSFYHFAGYYFLKSDNVKIKVKFISSRFLTKIFVWLLSKIVLTGRFLDSDNLIDSYKTGWNHTEIESLKRRRNRILYISGEGFRDTTGVKIHRNIIIEIFNPISEYQIKANQIVAEVRKASDRLVGIHIRRGDYRNWYPKYCLEDSFYNDLISQIENLSAGQTTVRFLVCSDEEVDETKYESNVSFSKQDPVTDMILLSRCDLIVGPPSTFSVWASYYGNVPLFTIFELPVKIDLQKFKVSEL